MAPLKWSHEAQNAKTSRRAREVVGEDLEEWTRRKGEEEEKLESGGGGCGLGRQGEDGKK